MDRLKFHAEEIRALLAKISMRHPLIGGIVPVLLLIFLIPTIIGLIAGLIWFIVKLPFNILHLIFVEGIGGMLQVIWRVFYGFFAIFGILGLIVMWLVIAAGAAFAAIFTYHFFRPRFEKYLHRDVKR